jgi:hypothetical protein
MDRCTLKIVLKVLPASEGGREKPIASGYRASFDIGKTRRREIALDDALVHLGTGEIAPGAEANATIEPLAPELWDHVVEGTAITMMEGLRVVAHATVLEVAWPTAFTTAVAPFVRIAREYCSFVATAHGLELDERLGRARELLLSLYAAGVRLPDVEPDTGDTTPSVPSPERWPGFDKHEIYWEVFDPYEHGEIIASELSDDVLDVYRDIRRGLSSWERRRFADAVWAWRFHFDVHWGRHATDALRALHSACARPITA